MHKDELVNRNCQILLSTWCTRRRSKPNMRSLPVAFALQTRAGKKRWGTRAFVCSFVHEACEVKRLPGARPKLARGSSSWRHLKSLDTLGTTRSSKDTNLRQAVAVLELQVCQGRTPTSQVHERRRFVNGLDWSCIASNPLPLHTCLLVRRHHTVRIGIQTPMDRPVSTDRSQGVPLRDDIPRLQSHLIEWVFCKVLERRMQQQHI